MHFVRGTSLNQTLTHNYALKSNNTNNMEPTYDTVIVGAGFAGMQSGKLLAENNQNVIVLEARSRKGGRTKTVYYDDVPFDVGGQWVGFVFGVLIFRAYTGEVLSVDT